MSWLVINVVPGREGRLAVTTKWRTQHWDAPCLCEPLTSEEIVDHWTPGLIDYERGVNVAYIDTVWHQLKPNGMWGYPEIGETFKKVEHGKWLLQGYEDKHDTVQITQHVEGVRITGLLDKLIEEYLP